MAEYISKSAVVAEIERLMSIANSQYDLVGNEDIRNRILWSQQASVCNQILAFIDTLEVKEVDLKQKSFVKIDRKLLFEICDAILNHDGYSDVNDCPENDSECFWGKWDEGFRKKVENIRKNS